MEARGPRSGWNVLQRAAKRSTGFILDDGVEVCRAGDAINEQHTIQMIELMVDNDGVESLEEPGKGSAALIETGDQQSVRPKGLTIQTREAEAPIEISAFVARLDDPWIDQSLWRTDPAGQIAGVAQADDDNTFVNVDLGGRKADPLLVRHKGVFQIADELSGLPVEPADEPALFSQNMCSIPVEHDRPDGHVPSEIPRLLPDVPLANPCG
jgi:hypothetical protein